jgi:hypothetical protein
MMENAIRLLTALIISVLSEVIAYYLIKWLEK